MGGGGGGGGWGKEMNHHAALGRKTEGGEGAKRKENVEKKE